MTFTDQPAPIPPGSRTPSKVYPSLVYDGDVPVSPPQKEGDVTHTRPDQVPVERRSRWLRAHPGYTGGS